MCQKEEAVVQMNGEGVYKGSRGVESERGRGVGDETEDSAGVTDHGLVTMAKTFESVLCGLKAVGEFVGGSDRSVLVEMVING